MHPFDTKITVLQRVCMIPKTINTDFEAKEAKDAGNFNIRTFS